MSRFVGILGSLLVHLLVFLMLTLTFSAVPADRPPAHGQHEGDDIKMDLLSMQFENLTGPGLTCAKSYRGIGVVTGFDGMFSQVVYGGPAWVAGARVGDLFVNESTFGRDRYEYGTVLPLVIQRDRVQTELKVVIGKICYE